MIHSVLANTMFISPCFSCKTCPSGSYRFNATQCEPCPVGQYTPPVKSLGKSFAGEHSESCQKCPRHMVASSDGLSCYSNCQFNEEANGETLRYDLSEMKLQVL